MNQLRDQLAKKLGVKKHKLAKVLSEKCQTSYQTSKNFVDGRDYSGHLLLKIIDSLHLYDESKLLQLLVLDYLWRMLPPSERERIISNSGLASLFVQQLSEKSEIDRIE